MAVILISGATGFIAGEIAGRLCVENKLIGLSRGVASTPPGFESVMTYEEFFTRPPDFDVLVNCAVANTNANVSDKEIQTVNVDLALQLVGQAAVSGARVVQLSSIHALDPERLSLRGISALSAKLAEATRMCEVFWAPLWDRFAGKLRALNNCQWRGSCALLEFLTGRQCRRAYLLVMDIAASQPDGPVILTDSLARTLPTDCSLCTELVGLPLRTCDFFLVPSANRHRCPAGVRRSVYLQAGSLWQRGPHLHMLQVSHYEDRHGPRRLASGPAGSSH